MSSSVINEYLPTFTGELDSVKILDCMRLFDEHLTTLKLNNTLVARKEWELTNTSNTEYFPRQHPYNSDWNYYINLPGADHGGKLIYYRFINEFNNYNFGIASTSAAKVSRDSSYTSPTIIPCAIESTPTTPAELTDSIMFTNGYNWSSHRLCSGIKSSAGNAYANGITQFKVFTYESENLSFISVYNLNRMMIFTYMTSFDDPSVRKPVMLMVGRTDTRDGWNVLDIYVDDSTVSTAPTGVDIFFGSRVAHTYQGNINPFNISLNKIILYKYNFRGFYSDKILSYVGFLPANHFIIDGHEYLKIAFDMLLRLT